ncbi:uncharacterized protein HMPREF1541_02548 [Cyphellophora europaea CBS 101466]|uniref:Uncharacterized protein n=1 Tax=Cyphellophora europaea (strain CBS 101466) TaxID=1220924 RepID=W2S652_CYPE1|nr:uncharacterized protein HMPREF1541_02548 [Cyphellophora europaea CBS 101466]ETN43389.1 hypothetical protein HMPREF1541_02548 [Cyphellophora europaea CBS 101466]
MATEPDASQQAQPPRRLKLVMPNTASSRHSTSESPNRAPTSSNKASSGSPERPSYSPVTPTLSEAALPDSQPSHPDLQQVPEFIVPPEPLPVSLDENTDAIAMRAALSILQMQRQQSLRDIRRLDRMKAAAIQDPEGFVEHLNAQKLSAAPRQGVDVDYDDDDDDDDDASVEDKEDTQTSDAKFPSFPTAQNVVRAPPIEWHKYGIVGEPLDRMHETQRKHPGWMDNGSTASRNLQPHNIAAPYKPFSDRLDDTKK